MMINRCYSVFDSKAQAFLQPFFTGTKGMAIRMVEDLLADDSHQFTRHIEDYSLYEVGAFDDGKGLLLANTEPQFLCSFRELKKEENDATALSHAALLQSGAEGPNTPQ